MKITSYKLINLYLKEQGLSDEIGPLYEIDFVAFDKGTTLSDFSESLPFALEVWEPPYRDGGIANIFKFKVGPRIFTLRGLVCPSNLYLKERAKNMLEKIFYYALGDRTNPSDVAYILSGKTKLLLQKILDFDDKGIKIEQIYIAPKGDLRWSPDSSRGLYSLVFEIPVAAPNPWWEEVKNG